MTEPRRRRGGNPGLRWIDLPRVQVEDRRAVLEIAQCLRRKGYTTARDIIRRDFENSLAYAKRMNILRMLVIGGEYCSDDEVYIVRVDDKTGMRIKITELFREDFALDVEP